ncbi:hypothetical protein XAB3213_2870025 [Xanthomonas citri pv. bilvae]|nr:hypothetical protein XAB3213_2870025 [Xanthomonas citri pv. bilvae]
MVVGSNPATPTKHQAHDVLSWAFLLRRNIAFLWLRPLGGYAYRHIAMQHERRTSVHFLQSGSLWTWITQWC